MVTDHWCQLVSEAQCSEAEGTMYSYLSCEHEGEVCCEPGIGYCQNPYTCVPGKACTEADTRDGQCVKEADVCCKVARCSANGGICSAFCIPLVQVTAPLYYCPGNQVCCRANL